MAYKFSGPMKPLAGAVMRSGTDGITRYVNKGIMRADRLRKRAQAERRNANTAPELRRSARRRTNG